MSETTANQKAEVVQQRLVTPQQAFAISEALRMRANEVACFETGLQRETTPQPVRIALQREIQRLRRLADSVNPPEDEEE